MTRVALLSIAFAVAVGLLGATDGSSVPAENPKLLGTVGPDFSIALSDAQGSLVTKLDPGTYDVEVQDLSGSHSFHLRGPGVN